ncbi:ATP-dependent RNA helicase DHX33 isoform X2 [Aplysia californica]|uniref:RNA helicase n=1 Tax=Aplysia californica TaxID=6500 RepID=A0ABM1A5W7_APLCA|nr:ATP-dependent RNA helicase DHX33 isoform X2 [Aplysia californica]
MWHKHMHSPAKKPKVEHSSSNPGGSGWSGGGFKNSPKLEGHGQPNEALKQERRALPIYPARQQLIAQIRRLPSAIVIGETGSGKTTQIPQYLLEAGVNGGAAIAITQPRRVAAVSVCQRVAQEKNTTVGTSVGYRIRFEDATSSSTKLIFMTDGMLLREAILDSKLTKYSVIVLDEAHERTVHTDVLFGVVKAAQNCRLKTGLKLLKIIVMSATMDVDHFSRYFNKAPVLYLEGRQFPIQVMHTAEPQSDYAFSSVVTLFKIHKEAPAREDVLIFLTGQDEIDSAVKQLRQLSRDMQDLPKLLILPLYAALPPQQQVKVFEKTPPGHRKVVIATNVAETSITIPGIKFVIDCGKVKAKVFNARTGLDILRVVNTSKAQTLQRTGRAGRESAGTCYRLFTEAQFGEMSSNTVPEIQRCNLSSVILQLMAMGISDVMTFDFMDKPDRESILAALTELELLGAVEKISESDMPKLTPLGKRMAAFPLDPKYAKIILLSQEYGCVEEVLTIVSILSVDDIFINQMNKRDEIQSVRQKFVSSEGDHITLLNTFRAFKSVNGNKAWCFENFINYRHINTAREVRKQLRDICSCQGIQFSSCGKDTENVRKCLAAGLFLNCAQLSKQGDFTTVSSRLTVSIHPASALFHCKPACVVYSELIKLGKNYMRNVSVVDPEWLQEVAPSYFKQKKVHLMT